MLLRLLPTPNSCRQVRATCCIRPLPEDIDGRVRSLSYPKIEAPGERLLDFRTLDDLRVWLDTNDDDSEGH